MEVLRPVLVHAVDQIRGGDHPRPAESGHSEQYAVHGELAQHRSAVGVDDADDERK